MVVLTLAMKITGFSDYYRQFKERYVHNFEKLYAGTSAIFGGKTFGVDKKKQVFGVANTTFL